MTAAYLLKEAGREVVGLHFLTGYGTLPASQIEHVGQQMGIPVKILDCARFFKSQVVDYFIQTYQSGKTPNPCLVCNPEVKFGPVLEFALGLGADSLATGHYARIVRDGTGRIRLLKGVDPEKDQSYFLAFMPPEKLSRACFPLGGMTKFQVRTLAAEKGLVPAEKKESQDVCFIRESYGKFLTECGGIQPRPGPIVTVNGEEIGRHQGIHLFTIGQRGGINCPGPEPYYVVRIEHGQNRLVVGHKKDLLCGRCQVENINWIARPPDGPIPVEVRVRYRHKAVPAEFIPANPRMGMVKFLIPEPAVTPGQGAVFYSRDEVLGGGWIVIRGKTIA